MRAEDIVRMANQIAQFFAPYPAPDAVAGIRDHLAKFWDPAMRRELHAIAMDHSGTESLPLDPLVLQAVLSDAPTDGS
jgi:formate dehydrogenase subunit delta